MNQKEVEIRKLQPTEIENFVSLIHLFEEVFGMKNFVIPSTDYLQKLLKQENFHVFAAFQTEKVISGLTAYVLPQYYSERPLAYIFDLAVTKKLQRQGIGGKLIAQTKRFFKEQGYEEVFVQADETEQHVLDFYRQTHPMGEEKVIHFYYTLNP